MAALMRSPRDKPSGSGSVRGLTNSATALERWMVNSAVDVDVVATSHDPRHPPHAMLDGTHSTFFVTTGMFPQEFIIGLKNAERIAEIKTTTRNVKKVRIDRVIPADSVAPQKVIWKEIIDKDFTDMKGKMQVETLPLNNIGAQFVRVTILEAYDQFAVVYALKLRSGDGKWLC